MTKMVSLWLLLLVMMPLSGCQSPGGERPGVAIPRADLEQEVDGALASLYAMSPAAKALAHQAKGVLVFPRQLKASYFGAASYGKGALRLGGQTIGYYNTVSTSDGLPSAMPGDGYALFFMDQDSLNFVENSARWEIRSGPKVVVVAAGRGRSLAMTTPQSGIYAFALSQQGLLVGLDLQGATIIRTGP